MGRSDAYASAYDLEAEPYVPLPKGDVRKQKNLCKPSLSATLMQLMHGLKAAKIL